MVYGLYRINQQEGREGSDEERVAPNTLESKRASGAERAARLRRARAADNRTWAQPADTSLAGTNTNEARSAQRKGERASALAALSAVRDRFRRSAADDARDNERDEPAPEGRTTPGGEGTKKPPDDQYLLALRRELEDYYQTQDEQIDRMRRVRQMEEPVLLPKKYRLIDIEVRSPVVADEVQRVSATLGINWAKLAVTPTAETDKGQENATLRESWTEEVLRTAGQRIDGVDTLYAAIDAAVGDGGAWTKFVFSKDLWINRFKLRLRQFKDDLEDFEDEEPIFGPDGEPVLDEKTGEPLLKQVTKQRVAKTATSKHEEAIEAAVKGAGPPFTWVCCDTRQVYPVWQGGKLAEVLEVQERPVSSVFRQYRLDYDADGNLGQDLLPDETWEAQVANQDASAGNAGVRADRSVIFLEHWDDEWVSYYCESRNLADSTKRTGKVVAQWKHGYGQVPYFYAPGICMSFWRNRKTGWGVAEMLRWLVEYQAFLMTLHAQVAARDTLPPFQQVSTDQAYPLEGEEPDDTQDDDVPDVWELRQILKNAPGRELKPLPTPDTAQALEKQIALIDQMIEKLRSVRPSSMIGGGLDGAGFAISQLLAEARVRHDPIAQNIERMLERVTRFAWKLVREKLKEAVWIYVQGPKGGGKWRSAGPDDLGDDVRIRWRLDPERASAKLIEARYWHERVKAETASLDQAITAMGDNPDEVREQRAMDAIRKTDFYQQRLLKRLAEKVGAGDAIQAAIADMLVQRSQAAQMAQGGIAGPAAAMGAGAGQVVPDLANLALSPNGAGAQGMPATGGMGPSNGSVVGAGPGAVVPQQAAAATIQNLVA